MDQSSESRLDVLLINPGNLTQVYQSLGEQLSAIEPPIWAGLIATFIRQKGFSVAILDAQAENLAPQMVAERVAKLNPLLTTVVVYGQQPSASTQNMPAVGAICNAIKDQTPESKLMLLGGHVASLPERTLRDERADFVCAGEGPYTILDLLQALKSGAVVDYQTIRDLWYRQDEEIKSGNQAALIKDLDREIPGIAWDLLPMERYRAHNWHCFDGLKRQPYAAIYTTLGCPYHCTFCCIQAPFRSGEKTVGFRESTSSYRYWSPESVITQIDILVNQYGVRNIKFADELFVLNRKHVIGICDLIIERGYDLNIWAYARVDSLRENMLEKLKKAGVNWLALGIESANERVRKDVNKNFNDAYLHEIIGKVRNAGIYVIGNYIFGLPEDDLESMKQTLNLAMDLNCEFANLYCAMAYPGSKLYETALKENWKLPEHWSGYSQHAVDTQPLPTLNLTATEVLRFRDQAFKTYFSNPHYLEMIEKKFGPETVHHIHEMASHTLLRNPQ
jgi:anaerobic magnesium-protoporphyrin IX monomethyl ester cyclase